MRLPSGMESSRKRTLTSFSEQSAAKIIPQLSSPQSFAGARFATKTTFLPISSSGLYQGEMPEQTCLLPSPSFTMSLRSFLDFLIGSHSSILAHLNSTFEKSSMPICARPSIFLVSSFWPYFLSMSAAIFRAHLPARQATGALTGWISEVTEFILTVSDVRSL